MLKSKYLILILILVTTGVFLYLHLQKNSVLTESLVSQNSKNTEPSKNQPQLGESKKSKDSLNDNSKNLMAPQSGKESINLTNQIKTFEKKAYIHQNGHAEVIEKLSESDNKIFRTPYSEKQVVITSIGIEENSPESSVGPIEIKTKPNQPLYLRAIDKGLFCNGRPEIFVRANQDGLAKVDFKLGIGGGKYRVLIQTGSNEVEQVVFTCSSKVVASELKSEVENSQK